MAAAAPVAQAPDAELIELGARFEPLVDQYYAARKRWARSLVAAHAEHDREFGADRNYDAACEALHAIFKEMAPLANAINAAFVSSIEGLRAKALVAFWEVAPVLAGENEFSFDDAYPFQRLFTAVAEVCGLKDQMAATGHELPDIGMIEAAPDDDADDDGEEA
jgi:hypothetical protein